MGRQLGVVQYRGKLGQTVGMKNGFGGSQAFNREYVATNASESDAQIDRRLRMLPAVNFRRQLDTVISRGWQGEKYGGPTNRKFMQNALRTPLANIPQLEKGDSRAIPGEYQISKGSIPTIDINSIAVDGSIETTLKCDAELQPSNTVAEFSSQLLQDNTFLREGDQITFIRVWTPDTTTVPYCVYEVESIQLDTQNTTPQSDIMDMALIGFDGALTVDVPDGSHIVIAAACVISREGTTPKRSSAYMTVKKEVLSDFFGSSVKANVRQSYKKSTAASMNTNWAYDPDSDVEDTGFVTIGVTIRPEVGGTVTGAGTYAKGDSVTLQATAAADYGFGHWELNGVTIGTTRTLQVTANGNANYVAEFLPET